ncbi:MAG TPA: EAL domain-containing protein, partial [Solirubrobacteraceae bacterium]|nr:EAL domain-containing protein [Solirubrobacteraceae bacterium]
FSSEEAQAARADARLSWAQRIRQALDDDGLVLHWQAIVDLASGRPSHGELLLRMRSGDKLLPPGEFLGAAERLGLIHAIDRWVVRQAIWMLARGRAPADLPLSVNLSGESVAGDPELLRLIEAELQSAEVDPSKLIFEVTETAAIANIVEAREFALGVRRLGCALALDDFGTGFGSFYHLKHLPVDFLKIDREFVHNLPHSRVDQRLVRSIVDVARALRIRTVAESVGDDATIRLLSQLGVDFIQGFHVGRPQPVG